MEEAAGTSGRQLPGPGLFRRAYTWPRLREAFGVAEARGLEAYVNSACWSVVCYAGSAAKLQVCQ